MLMAQEWGARPSAERSSLPRKLAVRVCAIGRKRWGSHEAVLRAGRDEAAQVRGDENFARRPVPHRRPRVHESPHG